MRAGWTVAAALVLLLATACSTTPSPTAESPTTAPPATTAPIPAKPDPKVGTCHTLTFTEATEAIDTKPSVRCRRPHSSVTFAVGQLDLLVDGHLVAMDSDTVGEQLDSTCTQGVARWVAGTEESLRLSRFRAVWFRPGVEEADRGASWYRCDVVAVAREGELARFRGDLKGALAGEGALDTWGTCGTSSPVKKGFRKVICSERHSWQAVSTVDLPRDAAYLGRRAARQADTACQDEATSRVNESLKFEWAFQWPTRKEWQAGQRYGWCWLPNG